MSYTSHAYTQEDFLLLKQRGKKVSIKLQILNDNFKPINELSGDVINGDLAITSSSMVRRTCSLSINLNKQNSYLVKEKNTWFNNLIKISIGFYSYRSKEIIYYNCGIYVFDSVSLTVDGSNYKMDISCVDLMGNLDATHKGQILGASKITYEAGYNIRKALIDSLKKYINVTDYYIEEIGTYYISDVDNPEADNTIPYDIELEGAKSILDIVTTLTQLYSFYETYIDVDGTFICKRMATKDSEPVLITNELFSQFVISEKDTFPITDVYNTIELWGQSIDYDRFSKNVSVSYSGTQNYITQYNVTYDDIDELANNTKFAFKTPSNYTTKGNSRININNFGSYPILNPDGAKVEEGYLTEDTVYVFKYNYEKFYLQGQYKVHAISMLFNEEPIDTDIANYKKLYNCNNISFDICPYSNFSVEKIGVKATTKESGEYDNITSDYLGLRRAEYELYKSAKITDTISLEMLYIPFLTVGIKIEYQPISDEESHQYLITDISTTISDGIVSTMTVSLTRFYNLYNN